MEEIVKVGHHLRRRLAVIVVKRSADERGQRRDQRRSRERRDDADAVSEQRLAVVRERKHGSIRSDGRYILRGDVHNEQESADTRANEDLPEKALPAGHDVTKDQRSRARIVLVERGRITLLSHCDERKDPGDRRGDQDDLDGDERPADIPKLTYVPDVPEHRLPDRIEPRHRVVAAEKGGVEVYPAKDPVDRDDDRQRHGEDARLSDESGLEFLSRRAFVDLDRGALRLFPVIDRDRSFVFQHMTPLKIQKCAAGAAKKRMRAPSVIGDTAYLFASRYNYITFFRRRQQF